MDYFLTGAGHFGFGFIIGAVFWLLFIPLKRKSLFIQMYSPFLPFLFGFVAAAPYAFTYPKTCEISFLFNVFVLYSWVHCQSLAITFLGNLHLVVVICGFVYCLIVLRYISLVKRVRRHGWNQKGGRRNA